VGEPKSSPRELRVCRAIALLAEGRIDADVARAVGVMARTLAQWQANADFQMLLRCARENGRLRAAADALKDMTPEALERLHRALANDDDRVAVLAAREVLDRVGLIRGKGVGSDQPSETIIRVEYGTPDGQPYSASLRAKRDSAASGAVPGGSVRETLREDGNGQTADD
jgi:hypothetical protein